MKTDAKIRTFKTNHCHGIVINVKTVFEVELYEAIVKDNRS